MELPPVDMMLSLPDGNISLQMYPFLKFLALLMAAALCAIGMIWLFQRKLIYIPMVQRVPSAESVLAGAREVTFDTEDGLTLRGWFVPAVSEPAGALLVFNGNAGNRSFRAPLAEALSQRGYAVMLFDYRGYGGNPGRPSERGLLADGRAARAWLESEMGLDQDRIAFFGESLGAAVALALAVERPPAALVLRSPFSSLVAIGRLHYPFLPVNLLLSDRYPSIDLIAGLEAPLLIIAGESDRIVPIEQSRELYEAAPRGRKRFVPLPGAGHNDYELLAGRRLIDETVQFLNPDPENK
jgi:fermentation-respiration switch protein FrsA (DUF1100 family)